MVSEARKIHVIEEVIMLKNEALLDAIEHLLGQGKPNKKSSIKSSLTHNGVGHQGGINPAPVFVAMRKKITNKMTCQEIEQKVRALREE